MKKLESKTPIRDGVRAVTRHIKPFKRDLTIIALFGIVSAIANGSVPYVSGKFFDSLIKLSNHTPTVGYDGLPLWAAILALWVLVQLVANGVDWVQDRKQRYVKVGLHQGIQMKGLIHMLRLPMQYHKDAHTNAEFDKLGQASWRVAELIKDVTNIAPQLLSIIVGIGLAMTISSTLGFVLVGGLVVYIVLLTFILQPAVKVDSEEHRLWNEAWTKGTEVVEQVESIKQAASEMYENTAVTSKYVDKVLPYSTSTNRIWSNVSFYQRFVVLATQSIILILSVSAISKGEISVGDLIALNGYAMMFFGPLVSLGHSWQNIQNGLTAATHAEEIFATPEEIYTPVDAVVPTDIKGDIVFDHVSFKYAEDQPYVLKDVSLNINAGSVVAFVGASGVGKSTTTSLVSAYYFPNEGIVTVDGTDTRRLDLHALRSRIAVVPQEVALFNDSILYNIRYGSFDATDEMVREVMKKVELDTFIDTLPEKYETLVGERGIKLSVGQKQRIAIARAMLRDPSILILDEPTSALDAQTEHFVTAALETLMQGRTTFIIAHRLATVRRADTILVFDQGTIVEQGTHAELITIEGGVYKKLYDFQIGLH